MRLESFSADKIPTDLAAWYESVFQQAGGAGHYQAIAYRHPHERERMQQALKALSDLPRGCCHKGGAVKVGVCISTVNEVETIGPLVRALDEKGYHIYVVDASTDDTWRVANEAGATVNFLPAPLGISKQVRMAWAMALKQDCDVIVQMDAGGSHDPEDAPRLVRALTHADMVVGSRFCAGAQYLGNPQRAFLSRVAAKMCNLKKGTQFTDWTSGYRAFTADAVRQLLNCTYAAQMHSFQIEVLDYALALGFKIVEVPIVYTAGRSSFNRTVAGEAIKIWGTL